jgi:hypothetical protein
MMMSCQSFTVSPVALAWENITLSGSYTSEA